jgi:hypothetical protein
MATFDDLNFFPHPDGHHAIQAIVRYSNDYGATVTQWYGTMGYHMALYAHCYEVTPLYFNNNIPQQDFTLYPDTMLAYSPEDVTSYLNQFQSLPRKQ